MKNIARIRNTDVRVVRDDTLACSAAADALPAGAGTMGETAIRRATARVLEKAESMEAVSVALPAFGCAPGGNPALVSAKIMAQEVYRHLRGGVCALREIVFALCDNETYAAFCAGVIGYLEHITGVLQWGPFICVDAIIEVEGGIILIQRGNPPYGWALPGGFVDYGESLESAVRREAREETGMELRDVKQFHAYSDPERDPRFHTIGMVFSARGDGRPKAGDDAAGLSVVAFERIDSLQLAFDHKMIIRDYMAQKKQRRRSTKLRA